MVQLAFFWDLFVYEHLAACVCVPTMCMLGTHGSQQRALDLLSQHVGAEDET